MRKTLSFLFFAGLLAGGAIAVVEVGLRATGYSDPIWYQPDAELGWSLRPGARGKYVAEGQSTVRISAAGMRDRSHPLEKPKNAYRIALLGDSFAEAMQVDFKDTLVWHLQEKLAACRFRPGQQVEVLNFGVSGYGLAQAQRLLETRAMKYSPDLVLLLFGHGGAARPDAVRVVSAPAPWQDLLWEGSEKLRAVQLFASLYHGGLVQSATAASAPAQQPGADSLRRIRETAARGGAGVMLVSLEGSLAEVEGVPVIPLAEGMRRIAQTERGRLYGFRNSPPGQRPEHWNERGHRAAAEVISQRLCAQRAAN